MDTQTAQSLFDDKAEAYAKHRPSYPPEVIDQILRPFDPTAELRAADVGAGTGIASRMLAERGIQVVAAEPNGAMIRSAHSHPGVTYQKMAAEQMELESNSVDLVTSFQAFHWFHFKKSLREFNRVLKPSGHLALVWNYWDTTDSFTAKYARIIEEAALQNPGRVTPYDGFPEGLIKKMRIKMLWKLRYLPFFQNVRRYQYPYTREADLQQLIGTASSQSYLGA